MKAVYGILFAILLSIAIYIYIYATSSPWKISAEKAKALISKQQVDVVLDVRTDFERTTMGFYPGSLHIQSADLEAKLPALYPNRDIRIIAYCNTGHRARMATDKLHGLGYKNAVYIATTYKSLM